MDGAELCVVVSILAQNRRKDLYTIITSREEVVLLVNIPKLIEKLTCPEVRSLKDAKEVP